jgi:hypothetical protein
MGHEIIPLGIGAFFGLGATVAGMVAPSYLNLSPGAVHWLFWGGLLLMAVMTVDGVLLTFWSPSFSTTVLLNVGLILVGMAPINEYSPSFVKNVLEHVAASPPNLYIECVAANLPDIWPNNPLYILELNPIPAPGGGGLVEYGVNNSAATKWGFQGMTYRCQIINYNDTPIFNV